MSGYSVLTRFDTGSSAACMAVLHTRHCPDLSVLADWPVLTPTSTRNTTPNNAGTVIGGLLAMYGHGNPAAVLPSAAGASGGLSTGGSLAAAAAGLGLPGGGGQPSQQLSLQLPPAAIANASRGGSGGVAAAGAGAGVGSDAAAVLGAPQGSLGGGGGGSGAAAGGAGGAGGGAAGGGDGASRVLVAGLNEEQSRDILREEIGGDSPRCSGGCVGYVCGGVGVLVFVFLGGCVLATEVVERVF